jgi:hypothetical protein
VPASSAGPLAYGTWYGALAVDDSVAYVAEGPAISSPAGVRVVDVTDPRGPYERVRWHPFLAGLNDLRSYGDGESIAAAEGRVYVASAYDAAVYELDFAEPDTPRLDRTYETRSHYFEEDGVQRTTFAMGLAVRGDTAWLAADFNGLEVLDLSPGQPIRRTGRLQIGHDVVDVAVAGDVALAALGAAGLLVADVSDPAHPMPIRIIDGMRVDRVTVAGGDALAGGWIPGRPSGRLDPVVVIFDLSDPRNPRERGRLRPISRWERSMPAWDGRQLFVPAGWAGLAVARAGEGELLPTLTPGPTITPYPTATEPGPTPTHDPSQPSPTRPPTLAPLPSSTPVSGSQPGQRVLLPYANVP